MISFRFHIVSIVAVFLALAIGIVVGSTLIDRAIVEGLRNRVDEVSDNLDERQAANERLAAQNDVLQRWIDDVGGDLAVDRLTDTFTVVIADEGLDTGPLDRTLDLLEQSGTTVRGVATLDGSWALTDPDRRAAVADLVGADPDDPVAVIQQRASELLVNDLTSPVEVVGDDTGALDDLSTIGVVDYEALDDTVAGRQEPVLVVVVSGPESDVEDETHVEALADAANRSSAGALVAEIYAVVEDGPGRGATLAPIIDSATLAGEVSTVDSLDLVPGPATAVLALGDLLDGEVGHYGFGDGADSPVPVPPEDG